MPLDLKWQERSCWMKVVHLVTTDLGGAYKAAERISEAMTFCGLESAVVVRVKFCKDNQCESISNSFRKRLVSKVKNLCNILLSNGKIHSELFGSDMVKNETVRDSDIIILHWINRFIGYKNIENILQMGKPVIWVMHDMWPFTGGCHYSGECSGYEKECVNCPYIKRKGIARRDRKSVV